MDLMEIQRLFRGINTRIADLHREDDALTLVCECGHVSCFRQLDVSAAEWAGICRTPDAFVVWREHVEQPMTLLTGHGETCVVHSGAAA